MILGAGAAGLFCAAQAGARSRRVALLEANQTSGRKILISGGGRCNFTNREVTARNFLSANPHLPKSALARFTPAHFLDLVRKHRIPCHEETLGQLFCDGSAREILRMLQDEGEAAGVEFFPQTSITGPGPPPSPRRRPYNSDMKGPPAFLLLAAAVLAAPRPPAPGSAANAQLSLDARLNLERTDVAALLGMDAGEYIVVVEITVSPKSGKLALSRDDFLLRSDRDGQRTTAAAPSQIAGSGVLVVGRTGGQQGTPMSERRRVPYGIPGIPGGGPGMPPSLPGNEPPTGGVASADTSEATSDIRNSGGRKESDLLGVLKKRILPEGDITAPASGLLYFILEGKQRPKDIELIYKPKIPAERLSLRFKEIK